jgi:hypothetical protein
MCSLWAGKGICTAHCVYLEYLNKLQEWILNIRASRNFAENYIGNWVVFECLFRWPCITLYQYSETNVMRFLFSLLRIKGLYMFRELLAHPQEALHKRHLVHCVHVMSVGCIRIGFPLQSWCSQLTKHARNITSVVCVAPPEDEQVMVETCRDS